MDPANGPEPTAIVQPLDAADFLTVGVIVVVAIASVVVVERLLPRLASTLGVRARALILPWVPVFRLAAVGISALLIIPIVIEPTTQNLIAVIGAGAVAIGFAFKDYLTSLLAGIIVLFERPYRQGDWVRIGDVYGEVREMGMRALKLVTPDDDVVTVPHGHIWNASVITANDGSATLQCPVDFYVAPEHDAQALQEGLADAALASPWLDVSKPVRVVLSERPFGTHYRVRAYPLAAADQFRFSSDVTVRGKAVLARLGVRPAQVVFAEAENPQRGPR